MANNQTRINNFFDAFENRLAQAIAKVPEVVGNVAVNYALDSFKNEAWEGVAWEKRKKEKKSKTIGTTGKLLVQSSRLKRSVRIIRSSNNQVTVGSDVPYATIHNYGGNITKTSRSETFVRNRYKNGARGKIFGGMGVLLPRINGTN